MDVGFAGAKIAALDGVFEKARNAVAVIPVVLRGVDPSLGSDGVCPSRGIVIGKTVNVVPLLAESRGRRRSRQTCADNDDGMLTAIRRIDQLHLVAALIPLLFNWT
jgi:hypothetical protein